MRCAILPAAALMKTNLASLLATSFVEGRLGGKFVVVESRRSV